MFRISFFFSGLNRARGEETARALLPPRVLHKLTGPGFIFRLIGQGLTFKNIFWADTSGLKN